jgi:lipoprotein-anchoring transpeptidase ErfK/SrfK
MSHLPKKSLLTLLQSATFRATILAIVGLSVAYTVATKKGLIPSIRELAASAIPVTCPADPTFHSIIPTNALNPSQSLNQLLPRNFDRTKTSILIEKSQRQLTLYYNQKPIKSYRVVFGNPNGDKRQQGDRKTPEGLLKIQDQYPHPNWSKFLWLDYPNPQSECKHRRAKQQGEIPVWSTIGSEVGIHGVPSNGDWMIEAGDNWTLGCISLKNADVDELYTAVQAGTIVEILP